MNIDVMNNLKVYENSISAIVASFMPLLTIRLRAALVSAGERVLDAFFGL
jgi:hypothetical protein|tara:strand:+ start:202 stop:351 length:150 start_codon:yes stop_codon:yes gene_type:complete